MDSSREKFVQRYDKNDLSETIAEYFETIQSPEGKKFHSQRSLDGTIVVSVGKQSFFVSVAEKEDFN